MARQNKLREPKPDESRLLTKLEIQHTAYNFDIPDGIGLWERRFRAIAKAQLAKDMEWEAKMEEHTAHLVDDVIRLEEALKQKDAECCQTEKRVEKLIDNYFETEPWMTREDWQALKKREGIDNG